jgi:hypothetical protein
MEMESKGQIALRVVVLAAAGVALFAFIAIFIKTALHIWSQGG